MADPVPESLVPDLSGLWTVYRIDDNGNTFVVREHLSREEADRVVAEFEARGHKQMYWAERERA
jgi:UDP-N-acetyl-2-amino-2-deoxyglucuronate dehydrogenase